MKILIVGSKEESLIAENQLKKGHQIVGYCDCFYFGGNKEDSVFSIDEINKIQCDLIILTIRNLALSSDLKQILIIEKNIRPEKILEFYRMYEASIPMMKVDNVMTNPNYLEYDGLILGISHSEVGIITKYLNKSFCNLAVSSQDLYFNLKTLEYCISNYYEKIKNLQYAVIDMFDYTYFNYDVSLSKTAISYWSWGGYNLDGHNFNLNKNFTYSFDQVVNHFKSQRFWGITEADVDAWESLFTNIFSYNNYNDFANVRGIEYRLQTVSDEQLKSFNSEVSIMRNKYEETINENIKIFDTLLSTLKKLNPDIKIHVLLMPKYVEIENRISPNREMWKKYFEDKIMSFKKLYNFEYHNLKNCTEISSHKMYYFDPVHLNYIGAINFTKYLNKLIFVK
ncbi:MULTISPECIES: hypothetical protein [unclassified Clostridium]|uniref:hypothetical protein n=1 Tax=unclassified Clostridium TaxID=2614128 RepID=UPI00029866D3|nr:MULTISPECIES: hypothetical protein [unclassified Clostridium]EKQ51065.1 MAG: hypothetical protein A370_05091 [Clostridium sp. Maddingley MBC34-26]